MALCELSRSYFVDWIYSQMVLVTSPDQRTTDGATPENAVFGNWEPHSEKVTSQVAAPTESSTPNLHRATIAQQRVRMEGWRQRRLGSNAKPLIERKKKNRLDTHRPSHGRTHNGTSGRWTVLTAEFNGEWFLNHVLSDNFAE